MFTPVLVGIVTLVALAVFFWKRSGPGSGRTFGNRVAQHLGIPRSLFHSLLDHGVSGSSRHLLATLERRRMSLDEAGVALGPALAKGIERLEAHVGPQEMIDEVKPVVQRLVAAAQTHR